MEPVTAIASAIATYILPEAFKEGGKALGKGVSQAVSQLITVIREKFKAAGREGTLADFEAEQTEENQSEFETVLKKLMKDDAFAKRLLELVKQLESEGLISSLDQITKHNYNFNAEVKGSAFGDNASVENQW